MYYLREEEIPGWEPGGQYGQLRAMLKDFNCNLTESRPGLDTWEHSPSGYLILVDVMSDGSFDLFVSLRHSDVWVPRDSFSPENDRREVLSLANTLKEVE